MVSNAIGCVAEYNYINMISYGATLRGYVRALSYYALAFGRESPGLPHAAKPQVQRV